MIWLRRLAWGIGAAALLLVVLWLAVPALLKWQLPLRASEVLGREVSVGDVRFQPWNLDLTLGDLAVAGPSGAAEPMLRIGRIHANLSATSLLRLAPVIEALEIDAPQLRVARTGDGRYDIDDLIARFTPKADDKTDESSEPARFALYNLQVRDAQIRFDDRPVNRVHEVQALQLALPFISNLPAEVEIKIQPRLAFRLNGAPFDSGAQATPFAQTKAGELKLAMADVDLMPYVGYLPASLPVRPTRGQLSTELLLNFAVPPGSAPTLAIKGTLAAKDLALTDRAGAPLASWQQLQLGLRDVQPLARRLAFDALRIDGLQLHATRDAAGAINLLQLAAPASDAPNAVAPPASPAVAASAASAATTAVRPAAPAWQFSIESVALGDARVLWTDAAVQPAARLQLDALTLDARQLRWPLAQPVPVAIKGALRTQGTAGPALAEFAAEGPVTDHDAKLDVKLASVSLAAFAPYLAQTLVPAVDGQLAAQARLDWSGAADAPRLQLAIARLALDDLKVREGSGRSAQDAVVLKQLALAEVQVDLLARSVVLGSVKLVQPAVSVLRDRAGKLNLQGWLAADAPVSGTAPATQPSGQPAPWRVQLKDLLLEGGRVRFADAMARRGTSEALRIELAELRVALQDAQWQGERAAPAATLQVSARIGPTGRERQRAGGTLDYKGRVGWQPLQADGTLRIARFPVALFAPYFDDQVKLSLLRAEAGYTGTLKLRQLPAGLDLHAAGDLLFGDVHIASPPDAALPASTANTDELLSWQSFALKGVKVTLKPRARPQIDIAEAALSDFYSRLVITEQGRFNLRDVAGDPEAPRADGAAAPPPAAAVPVAAASAASAAATDDAELPVDIRIGATRLNNGRVDFADRFVRPNYSAALTELNGELGAFSSGSREMAALVLRGRAAGTALLAISGRVNPMAKPLALDIRAQATDLELAPLSPYAGKYAGYAIERGKLSMDVTYKIDADGKLTASNQVVLNQLTFGDRIESKDATKLPVRLAVALLKDRNGVIDVNLPVSGSINDPQFSVGGIVVRVIVNLLTKALTAPFSLLAGGGGGDDLSQVEFKPGTAQVAPVGTSAIDKVAKALAERPALKMTVTGSADPVAEREPFQAAALDARLLAQRRREGPGSGATPPTPASAPASAPTASPPELSAAERARLLKQVYEDSEIPEKPRNALGFAKDLPGPEMEALLKARVPVSPEAMRELALQRGIAVRDALLAKGLTSDRLFLAAPTLRATGEGGAPWTPQVRLSLSAN